jgi:DNA-binding FadR family transcriptional regulator
VVSRRVIILPGRAEVALQVHRELLQALARKDPDRSEKAITEILSGARALLEKYQNYVI